MFIFDQLLGPCRPEEWTCDNGECIHEDRVCDFREDCRDGSDEEQNCKHCIALLFLLLNKDNILKTVQICDIL